MPTIQEIAQGRGVPFLVHFTRTTNLRSIMAHGLLPRDQFESVGISPDINDELRLDGRLNGISVSIAFPNSRMLWKLRQQHPSINWVVLAICPSVLWTHSCAFCRHNAADSRISTIPVETLKFSDAFESMYGEGAGVPSRQEDKLKCFDPSDVQAEVLVFNRIAPDQIIGAAFQKMDIKLKYDQLFINKKSVVHGSRGFFSDRKFSRLTDK